MIEPRAVARSRSVQLEPGCCFSFRTVPGCHSQTPALVRYLNANSTVSSLAEPEIGQAIITEAQTSR